MEIYDLKLFISLAKLKNFGKTAEEFFISQPALSRRIKNIENELEVTLIYRKGTSIELSEYGEIFYKYCEEQISNYKNLKIKISEENRFEKDKLSVICLSTLYRIGSLVSSFMLDQQGVQLHFLQHHVDRLETYDWDLKIFCDTEYLEAEDTALLYREDIVIALAKDHPLCQREALTLEEIKEEKFVFINQNPSINKKIQQELDQRNLKLDILMYNDDYFTVKELVKRGSGISLVPKYSYGFHEEPGIVLKQLEDVHLARYNYICFNRAVERTKMSLTFDQYMKDFYHPLNAES